MLLALLLEKFGFLATEQRDGLRAFVVAWCACAVQGVVFGMVDCLPTLFGSILDDKTIHDVSMQKLSLVLGLASGLQQIFGLFAGHYLGLVGSRFFSSAAVLLCFLSFFFVSYSAKDSSDLFLFISIPYGAAMGFMLTPGATASATWFNKKRSLAQGIVFSGGGLGPSILSPIAGAWVAVAGWRETMRKLSYFGIGGLVFSFLVTERRNDAQGAEEEEMSHVVREHSVVGGVNLHETRLAGSELLAVFGTPLFMGFFTSCFFFGISFYSFLYLAVPYAVSMGSPSSVYSDSPSISIDAASTLMTFFGVFFTIGSIFMGYHGHHAGDDALYTVCTLGMGIVTAMMPLCRSFAAFAACYSLYGFLVAGVWATVTSLLVDAFAGPNLGNFISAAMSSTGIAAVIAPYLQSSLAASHQGDFTIGLMLMSVASAASALAISISFSYM